jgi:T-complex protein 1 subunit beta
VTDNCVGRSGYREACNIAQERLEAVAVDHSAEPDAFRNDLLNIARTTLSSKILTQVRRLHFMTSQTPKA